MKYLGIELLTRFRVRSKVAESRFQSFNTRLSFIRALPPSQRDIVVCDAVSSLYLDGGVILTRTQLRLMVAKAATTLMCASGSKCRFRSRLAARLVGVGCHRTHPAAAAVMASLRRLWRQVCSGCFARQAWEDIYYARRRSVTGTGRQLLAACREFGISWSVRGSCWLVIDLLHLTMCLRTLRT